MHLLTKSMHYFKNCCNFVNVNDTNLMIMTIMTIMTIFMREPNLMRAVELKQVSTLTVALNTTTNFQFFYYFI